jgi:hypothetical protein
VGTPFLLAADDDELTPKFSFSSSSVTLGTGLALTLPFEIFPFTCDCCSSATDDTLRYGKTGVGVVPLVVLAEDDRERDETRPVGVGVPTIDARDLGGGGPIAPSREARTFVAEEEEGLVLRLTRALFPSAAILEDTDRGISEAVFFGAAEADCMRSLPESEMTEGGREPGSGVALGVTLNIDESRRCVVLEGRAGVLPAVPRTPIFRFI